MMRSQSSPSSMSRKSNSTEISSSLRSKITAETYSILNMRKKSGEIHHHTFQFFHHHQHQKHRVAFLMFRFTGVFSPFVEDLVCKRIPPSLLCRCREVIRLAMLLAE